MSSYLRFPNLHGDLVSFVAEDDVWLAPLDGGRAWRVSADRAPVSHPRFSPDGRHLAWTSTRDDAPEVHVTEVDGGRARRLTYWGDSTTGVRGWTPEGEVLAISSVGQASTRRTWAHAVSPAGGPSRRLPYGPVGDVAFGPAGEVLLLTAQMRHEPAWWKRYRGGAAGKFWLATENTAAGRVPDFRRLLAELDGNLSAPMWVSGRIAFLSDHAEDGAGVGNLYSVLPDGSDLRQHTAHTEFYARHATTDGERVVYQSAGDLWLVRDLSAPDVEPVRLDVRPAGPRPGRQPWPVRAKSELTAFSADATGQASAIGVRGTVHWLTHRDGPARVLSAETGVRARLPVVSGCERQHVVWVTDADGEDALEVSPAGGLEPGTRPRRLASGRLGRVLELAASPDGRWAAVATHDGRLVLVDLDSGEPREVTSCPEGEVAEPTFSPDSTWLAWSHPGPAPLSQIRLANVTDLSTVEVTPLRFADSEPVFTPDGKYLMFLSVRSFDPVYDAHVFDLSFPTGCRPYLVPLAGTTPSPFDPLPAGRAVDPSHPEASGPGRTGESGHAETTAVDPAGLADRVVPFPVPAGRYRDLRAVAGGAVWLSEPTGGVLGADRATPRSERPGDRLEHFGFAGREVTVLRESVEEVSASGDGKRLVVEDSGGLRVMPAERPAESKDVVEVDLDRVRVTVDPGAEWHQEYDEAGRLMRDHFWRADMGGVDWSGVLARYRPLVDRVATHGEFADVLWEVQGELGTSHAYVIPPSEPVDPELRQGLLGADVDRDEHGTWRIARVLPGETSDPQARSPLAAPGVAVRAGDAVLAVDGCSVDAAHGPAPLLAGTAHKPVELLIAPAGGGEHRRVVAVPVADDKPLRYHDWVADRRRHVQELAGGRLGYLHVPDMIASGWAQLHRDLRVETEREALVVDVRENRGGHTSQLVVEKLARTVIGWQTNDRGYRTRPYPQNAPRGPVVAVANEFSGSDGDIVNAALKALGIGPVVGTRTWGGVVGIDMRYRLVDGTLVTQPRYATWLSGPGWGVENHGVDPDVEVAMTPQDWGSGRDPQLDTAVRVALDALRERPAATPPAIPEV